MRENTVVYRRSLPGGGWVAICATPTRTLLGQRRVVGTIVVERRALQRREGHEPPVVARSTRDSLTAVLNDLFPVAQSNAALAAECLRPRDRARPATAR